jgi:RND family efflux transporter MFP subunit
MMFGHDCIRQVARFSLMALALAGCRGAKGPVETKPPEVVISEPITRPVLDTEEFTGRMDAIDSIEVRARVTGYLDTANFKDGDEVLINAELFMIDPRPYKAALDQATAQIVLAEARLKDATADVERNRSLVNTGATSKSDFDKFVADRDVAAAQVEAAKATAETNRLNLAFCRVAAPIAGRISRRYVDPGNLVRADETVLTRIVSQDPIYAYFDVDERTLLKIRRLINEGKVQSARTKELWVALALSDEQGFDDENGKPRHPALFDFADNRVDPATGTLQVRAKIENQKLNDGIRLFSAGMFVRVRLPIGSPREALLVSEKALGTDQGQKFVFVVTETDENGKKVARVSQRTVKVGSLQEGYRVIEYGLKAGEKIVISGLQRIRDGSAVTPTAEKKQDQQAGAKSRDSDGRGQ